MTHEDAFISAQYLFYNGTGFDDDVRGDDLTIF